MKRLLAPAVLACLLAPASSPAVDFEKEILPIFQSRCFRCHGNGEAKGSLSLEPAEIQKHIKSSGQINPGNSGRSILMERLTTDNADDKMPRNGALAQTQIDLIKQWIDEGAKIGGEPDTKGGDKPDAPPAPAAMARPEPVKGTWTNAEGKAIEATLIRVDGENAVLVLANGTSVPYPIAKLSAESQAKVKAFQEATTKAAP
ncbi:MAG: hypothetical protein JNK37_03540 [Verrucomicrobiales bacterium]|nr:hypothetical protein [Verrucomicrobiales bacterium]